MKYMFFEGLFVPISVSIPRFTVLYMIQGEIHLIEILILGETVFFNERRYFGFIRFFRFIFFFLLINNIGNHLFKYNFFLNRVNTVRVRRILGIFQLVFGCLFVSLNMKLGLLDILMIIIFQTNSFQDFIFTYLCLVTLLASIINTDLLAMLP